jgi:hypothetical protein
MGGKKEVAEGIVEQALKLITGGAETAAPKVAYHATQEPFENYDWSRLGQTTKENTSGTSVEDWALALARLGPWSHEKPLSKKIGMKTDLPVMLTGKEREFKSLDHLAKAISRNGGPEALRGKLVSKGYGHVSVNDEEFGGKSYVGLSPEYFSITKAAGGRTGYQTKGRVVGDAVDAAMRLIAGVEPQKTAKAYKLFKQREGKLYPLFVDANEEVPLNQWLKAKAGEQAASGKVRSKIGELAYRPGWHAGDLPIATHIGARSHGNPKLPPDTRPSDQVWAEVDMADDVDWQKIANERARMTKKGTPDPKTAHITDQVPYGGYYRYKTNPNMTGNWMIGGDMRVNRVLTDDEVKAINEAAGVSDLPRREGYGPGGFVDDIVKMAGKIISGADEPAKTGIRAYHGSPHDFPPVRLIEMPDGQRLYQNMGELADTPQGAKIIQEYPLGRFDMSKIGTGEGAQAYGNGLYFAENEGVAKGYRDRLTDTMKPGDMTDAGKAELQNRLQTAYADMANRLGMSVEDVAAVDNSTADELFEEMKKVALSEGRDWFNFPKGSMYEVNIAADPNTFLDWDKPLSEQPEAVRRLAGWTPEAEAEYRKASKSDTDALLAALEGESQYVPAKMPQPPSAILPFSATGDELHQKLFHQARRELEGRGASGAYSARVAEKLREAGIPGIKYLDAGSRGAGEGTRNYVVFDDRLISIIRKYGIAGASAMLGYNLMEQLDPKQALAASMADQDYQSSRPQRSMGGNNSISGALNVARGLHGVR